MNITQLLFSFDGRIRRTHYWLGSIGAGLAYGVVLAVILLATGGAAMMAGRGGGGGGALGMVGIVLCLVVYVALLWTSLALLVKRWHDRDKGWPWVFIAFIPIVGAFWILIECGFLDGTPGPNRFGPSPKGIAGPADAAPASS
ncbi:MAG: DUF805 domain-containing protein [Caulobacterales bacterium]